MGQKKGTVYRFFSSTLRPGSANRYRGIMGTLGVGWRICREMVDVKAG